MMHEWRDTATITGKLQTLALVGTVMPAAAGGCAPEPLTTRDRCPNVPVPTRGRMHWPWCAAAFPVWPNPRCATFEVFAGWSAARWLPERCHRRPGTARFRKPQRPPPTGPRR